MLAAEGTSAGRAGGSWLRVPAHRDGVLVNVGDFLERWTRGALPSTLHRVVAGGARERERERLSLVFFAQPDWDASLHPLTAAEDDDTGEDLVGDIMPF